MGKIQEHQPTEEPQFGASGYPCSSLFSKFLGAFSPRCVLVLILCAGVCLSAIFWLPPFYPFGSGRDRGHLHSFFVPIQASFKLQKPISLLTGHTQRLEYDILQEIGVPNTMVSVISFNSSATSNWTNVVFGVLPDPIDYSIPPVDLSVLRSSLVGLVLQLSNLTLTPSIFGKPTSFEILKFPGGITVNPGQPAAIWLKAHVLFNFSLNNSISEIQENLGRFKVQLKNGLQLRYDENVYVQVTNLEGSTLDRPVIVLASVLEVGNKAPLPERLKELAEALTRSNVKNLGLDHAVFGKVNQIQLSSFLKHSLAPSPCPSPSPSPSPSLSPSPSPSQQYSLPPVSLQPSYSPSYAPSPFDPHHLSPCAHCKASPPCGNTFPYAPTPDNRQQAFSPSPLSSPAPEHRPPSPSSRPTFPPNSSPKAGWNPLAPSTFPKRAANPPRGQTPRPQHDDRSGRNLVSSPMSPSPASSVADAPNREIWLIGLLLFVMYCLFCGPYC